MPISNWIYTGFADRPNFVSDAPQEVGQALAELLLSPSGLRGRCEFGKVLVQTTTSNLTCLYVRYASATSGTSPYVHAIVQASDLPEPSLSSVESLFKARYGAPPEARIAGLVEQYSRIPVAQATLSVTDFFVAQRDFDELSTSEKRARKSKRAFPGSSATPAWLVATAAMAIAGFAIGTSIFDRSSLPQVESSPPADALTQRIEKLEAAQDQGIAGISLRGQLDYEREAHRQALEAKERELQAFAAELDAMKNIASRLEPAAAPGASPALAASAAPGPPALAASPEPPAPPASVANRPVPVRSDPALSPPRVSAGPTSPTEAAPGERAVVRADLLWVRDGPGIQYLRLTALDGETVVDLSGERHSDWVEISAPERGWVSMDFLEFLAAGDASGDGAEATSYGPVGRRDRDDDVPGSSWGEPGSGEAVSSIP